MNPTLCLVLTASLFSISFAAMARADHHRDDEAPLYLGQRNHVKVSLGLGFAGREGSDLLALQPTLEARIALGETFGLQLVVPTMFVDLSTSDEGAADRFELANPTVAFEVLLDSSRRAVTLVRMGAALPLLRRPELDSVQAPGDRYLQAANVAMAVGARGLFDMWRYTPETFALFVEFQTAADIESLYLDLRAGIGLLIPVDSEAETELTMQVLGRIGYGDILRPFVGAGLVLIPTETSGLASREDAFQFGLQGGVIVDLGGPRIEAYAQLNIDEPAGFSFDDHGVFGVHLEGTVPF